MWIFTKTKVGRTNLMKDLALHGSLLISFLFIIGQLARFFLRKNASTNFLTPKIQVMAGLSLGFLGVILIYFGIYINEHVIIDFRHIAIVIAATFFGFPAALLSSILIAIMRLFVGGINEFSIASSILILLIGLVTGLFSRLSIRNESRMLLLTLASTLLIYITFYINLTILSDNMDQFKQVSQIYWIFSLIEIGRASCRERV